MTTIRYDLAAQDIEDTGLEMKYITPTSADGSDGKWCMTRNDVVYYDAPTKQMLIEAYCNHDLSDYTYPDDIKCECGNCHTDALYFKCKGCLSTVGYCMGQSDRYFDYCTDCWYQLSHDLTTVVTH